MATKKKSVKAVSAPKAKKPHSTYKPGQYVYSFGEGYGTGATVQDRKNLLGGKGAGLAERKHIGILIPDGFTVTTEACTAYYDNGRKISKDIQKQIKENIKALEERTGKSFGHGPKPLLVSVRSGARVSRPGRMDTILNLGLNDETVEALAKQSGKPRFAYDSYRRFILRFTNIAKGWPRTDRDKRLEDTKARLGIKNDKDVPVEELQKLVVAYKEYYKKTFKEEFPSNPVDQLRTAVEAIFHSWDNERATLYRKMNNIPYSWGTTVNVQSMAFGNRNDNSGTGVGFTRQPTDGHNQIFAEYLINAQGEDVVAGIRTPLHIEALKEQQPHIYKQLVDSAKKLEKHYKDRQDFEFTVEDGKLYFLQTRNGKRTGPAALQIATDMVKEGLIDEKDAILRVEPRSLDQLLHPTFVEAAEKKAVTIATGNPAGPGAAVGHIVFTAEKAQALKAKDKNAQLILVRAETSPEDLGGMVAAQGVLTRRGGRTSHAAVVARQIGKTCITGCGALKVDEVKGTMELGGKKYKEGDVISLNGSTGCIYDGAVETKEGGDNPNFKKVLKWADKYARIEVKANADTPEEAAKAIELGAKGIGLCRTEHRFRGKDRLIIRQQRILSDTTEERVSYLNKLEKFQEEDFYNRYLAVNGINISVRLLDPPLDEYLPNNAEDIASLAKKSGKSVEQINRRITELHRTNPMMGLRGCRLDVVYPEIGRRQAEAVIKAALRAEKTLSEKAGKKVHIVASLMVPQVVAEKEFVFVKNLVSEVADKIIAESDYDKKRKYIVGTMVETPRAALTGGQIGKHAAYFSYGTNDLTQFTFGFSRNDYSSYITPYLDEHLIEFDPFKTIDNDGVGRLIARSVKEGKEANPDLHCGVCGEAGGDPESIALFDKYGIDYVSCSPFRVPGARLAAAQAEVRDEGYQY